MKDKVVFLATGNIHKFNEARAVLAEQGLTAAMLRMKGVEIQSENLAEIAGTSALATFKECHLPIIVEDAGLFVDALKGFPGPYTASRLQYNRKRRYSQADGEPAEQTSHVPKRRSLL